MILTKLSEAFLACDGVTMEINPLVVTKDEALVGLDARVEIEDEAVYRQRETVGAVRRIDDDCGGTSAHPSGIGSPTY